MERRRFLEIAGITAAGIALTPELVLPKMASAEVSIPDGMELSPEAINDYGKILNPKASEPTAPLPLGNVMDYLNYQDVLGGNRKGGRPLMEQGYDLNAESDNVDYRRNFEGNPYAVVCWQGEEVEVPGLAHLTSQASRESVILTWIHLDKNGIAWRSGAKYPPILVKAGFINKGNIVDGSSERDVLERNHTAHWIAKQFTNEDYPGITGRPEQAQSVLYASFMTEGQKHRLIRAGRITR